MDILLFGFTTAAISIIIIKIEIRPGTPGRDRVCRLAGELLDWDQGSVGVSAEADDLATRLRVKQQKTDRWMEVTAP